MKKFEEINIGPQRPEDGPITDLNNNMALVFTQYKKMREYATKLEDKLRTSIYKSQLERERRVEVQIDAEEISELKRENQRLRAENLAVKPLVEDAKKQQPEIPEVPQFVADWYEQVSPIFVEACIFDFILSNPQRGADASSEFEKWFMENNNSIEILIDMKRLGYTVAKEKRFYLKHKSVLIFDPDSDDSDVEELYLGAGGNFVPYKHLAKIFTQSQIDSMETGSYEQIEVEE